MKIKNLAIVALLCLGSCGYSAMQSELVGQAKKITMRTPLICDNYMSFDVSLGVMRGGTGSMSTQDMWLTVQNMNQLDTIKKAVETGALVKVTYNSRRMAFCTDDHIMTNIEIVN